MRGFESHPYIPNSVPDVQAAMLKEIGMSSLEELHKNVPELLKLKEEMNLPEAFGSEYELRRHVERLLSKDTDLSLIHIWMLASRLAGLCPFVIVSSWLPKRFAISVMAFR